MSDLTWFDKLPVAFLGGTLFLVICWIAVELFNQFRGRP